MSVSSFKPLFDATMQNDFSKVVSAQRHMAFEKLSREGFPTRKNDDWKYTSVKPLVDTLYKLPGDSTLKAEAFATLVKDQAVSVSFFNGRWTEGLSHLPAISGLSISKISANPTHLELNVAPFDTDPLDLLNTSLCRDGVVIDIAPGAQIEPVIYINHFFADLSQATIAASRTIVRLASNSKCAVVEKFQHLDQSPIFSSHIMDVKLSEGSDLTVLKDTSGRDEYCHVGHTAVTLADRSKCQAYLLQQGGRLARHSLTMNIEGQEALAEAYGIYLLRNRQHSDQKITIDHIAPQSSSRQIFKGVLDDRSRGVFNGKIFIRKGAQGTDARQLNKNLLLSSEAEADTKPELNIDADDVGCSHGATVGQLNDDEVFYLQSRGLSKEMAKELLCRAFAADVLTSLTQPELRKLAEGRIDTYFEKGANYGS